MKNRYIKTANIMPIILGSTKVRGWSIAATTATLDFHRWTGNVNLSYIRVCAFISADNRWPAIDSHDIDFIIDISAYPFAACRGYFLSGGLLFRRGQSISSECLSTGTISFFRSSIFCIRNTKVNASSSGRYASFSWSSEILFHHSLLPI